jgi:hypothetical protein
MAVTITWVKTRQIFISRGNPTVEVRHFALPSLPGAVNLVLPLFSFCLDQRLSPTLLEIRSSSVCLCPGSARRCAQDLLTSGFVFYVGSRLTMLCGCAQVRGPQRRQLREGGRTQRRIHWYVCLLHASISIHLALLFFECSGS